MKSNVVNTRRFILAVVVAFVFVFVSNFLIHGMWMGPVYAATMELWRSEAEMQARFPWMLAGQFLAAFTFVSLWTIGLGRCGCKGGAITYGVLMGLFSQANTLITYVVSPLTPEIAIKWFVAGLAQGVLLGLITHAIYKPPVVARSLDVHPISLADH